MTHQEIELLIVMPVYNEQESIRKVVTEWLPEIERATVNFQLLAIDDGSTDDTPAILNSLRMEVGSRFEFISRGNRGHGQTCMQGYRLAVERKIPYILQIDSDGQSDPRYFSDFWNRRNDYDVIYGKRVRQDGIRRIVASLILKLSLRLLARVDCVDPNVPYRLMNTRRCATSIALVPTSVSLANVALAVSLRREAAVRHGSVEIGFPPRHGGEASVPFSKFAFKAFELFQQMRAIDRR